MIMNDYKEDRSSISSEKKRRSTITYRPSPAVFVEYLPWACKQLQFSFDVHIATNVQDPFVKSSEKAKRKSIMHTVIDDVTSKINLNELEHVISSMPYASNMNLDPNAVKLTVTLNFVNQLVELKFVNNERIPCVLVILIGKLVQFQPKLHSITINKGADANIIYRISKFLPDSHITDICLDGMIIKEANYHLLLEWGKLKYLSLSRCMINDDIVDKLASTLEYRKHLTPGQQQPAGMGLVVLNLSCNVITDRGAIILANMLRSNRSIAYLNLSGNQISDSGACSILDVLTQFALTFSEVWITRNQLISYIFAKTELYNQCLLEVQLDKTLSSKKSPARNTATSNRGRTKSDASPNFMAKAEEMVAELMGEFKSHPFCKDNTCSKDGKLYCKGNNCLAYLGLAYNNLSVFFLKRLHNVLKAQGRSGMMPRGLMMVTVEGNPLPEHCIELEQIDIMLLTNLSSKSSINLKNRITYKGPSNKTR